MNSGDSLSGWGTLFPKVDFSMETARAEESETVQRRSLHTCPWLALLMGILIFPASALANEAQSESTPADSAQDTSAEDDASKDEAADDPVDDVIVVTGSRLEELQTKSAVRSTVIDSLSIEDSGAETLAELLEHYPGIQIDYSYRGGSVKIRGLSSKYVLILET